MRSVLPVLLVVFVFAGAAACGDGGTTRATPTPRRPTPAAASPATRATSPTATSTRPSPTLTAAPTPTLAPSPTPTVALQAATATPAAETPVTSIPTAAPSRPAPGALTVTIAASGIAFDRSSVTVPAGALVTLVFRNDDAGIDHNLTVTIPGTAKETCTGPCQTVQTFPAPAPGSYYFACTIHAEMFGTFTVE